MKMSILILCLSAMFAPAFADEPTQKIIERKTCEQIKTEIATLKSMDVLDSEQQAELKQLSVQQRANCGIKSAGRRTIPRVQVSTPSVDSGMPAMVESDVLTEYMNNKKANCDKLNTEIEKLVPDTTKVDVAKELQRVYDNDCVERDMPTVDVTPPQPPVPEKSDEEWAAEFDANLAAGLCGDGTKPNRFGCCTGETFKDLGNLGFACCPKSGGDCFPPIQK